MVKAQQDYLTLMESRTPAHVWFSRLIRKLWDLQKKMWDHRNSFVHKTQSSMHEFEVEAMNTAIRWEFTVGRNELPVSFSGFFRGTVERILQDDAVSKSQWLHSIWLARDFYRLEQGLDPWPRDAVAATFIQRDRIRRKKRNRGG